MRQPQNINPDAKRALLSTVKKEAAKLRQIDEFKPANLVQIRARLKKAFDTFYSPANIDRIISDAVRNSKGIEKINKQNLVSLRARTRREMISQAHNVIDEMVGRARTKSDTIKIQANSQRLTIAEFKKLPKRQQVKFNGALISRARLDEIVQTATRRYGRADSVQFRNGAHYPLEPWADLKARSVPAEVHRFATQIIAQRNQKLLARVSAHGSKDSCIYHENEICFYSKSAKEEFRKLYRIDVRHIKTVEQLAQDQTHLFKPNCVHQLKTIDHVGMTEKELRALIRASPRAKIPRKINEHKLGLRLKPLTPSGRRSYAQG